MTRSNKIETEQYVSYELGNPRLTNALALLKRISNSSSPTLTSEEDVIIEIEKEATILYEAHLRTIQKQQFILKQVTHRLEGQSVSASIVNEEIEDDLDTISLGIHTIFENENQQHTKNLLFRDIFQTTCLSFCVFEPLQRTIETYNPSFNGFFELPSDTIETLASYRVFDMELSAKIDAFYLSEEQHLQFEHVFNLHTVKRGLVQLTKLKEQETTTHSILVFITDISSQVENEIIKKEKKIIERNLDLKNTFIHYFSNEIIFPLYKIITAISSPEVISTLSKEQRIELTTLKNQCQSINVLIDETLHDERLNEYQESTNKQSANLVNLIQEVLASHYFHAISKNVFLDFEVEQELPSEITIDAVKISMILNNLLSSTLKLIAKDSKIVISVSSMLSQINNSILYFEVKSIQNEHRAIPHPTYTSTNPSLSGVDTFGLGLPISEKLVEYLGGKLEFNPSTNAYYFTLSIRI